MHRTLTFIALVFLSNACAISTIDVSRIGVSPKAPELANKHPGKLVLIVSNTSKTPNEATTNVTFKPRSHMMAPVEQEAITITNLTQVIQDEVARGAEDWFEGGVEIIQSNGEDCENSEHQPTAEVVVWCLQVGDVSIERLKWERGSRGLSPVHFPSDFVFPKSPDGEGNIRSFGFSKSSSSTNVFPSENDPVVAFTDCDVKLSHKSKGGSAVAYIRCDIEPAVSNLSDLGEKMGEAINASLNLAFRTYAGLIDPSLEKRDPDSAQTKDEPTENEPKGLGLW